MDGSHRTRAAGRKRRATAVPPLPVGPRHASRAAAPLTVPDARPLPVPEASTRLAGQPPTRPSLAELKAASRERMMHRRRRSLGALSFLVLAVTVGVTMTRPEGSPTPSAGGAVDDLALSHSTPAGVYTTSSPSSVPPGAAAPGSAAADLTSSGTSVADKPAEKVTWISADGARIHCPVSAVGCVDLANKVTWVQRHGKIVLGPVRMQPGEGVKKTPKGTFYVNRKAAVYFSHTYGGAMPYSVFFGHDGIAWHEGTLTGFSHGCIHLSMKNAKRFFATLHLGDKVYVA